MYGTGRRAGDALVRMIKGQAKPTTAWGNVPMLPHVMRQGTADEPNRSLQARCQAMEAEGALCASLFVGFPHADISNAGLSVVVTTDNDMALAERWRDELLAAAWAQREAFVYKLEPLEQSVARAKAMIEGPGVPARPLRQRRLGRADGHHARAGRDHAPAARQRGGLRHLRSRRGAAVHRCRHRRDAHAVHRRQAEDADVPRAQRAAAGHRPRQDRSSTAGTAPRARWPPARSRTWAMRWCWTPAASRSCCSRAMSSPST